MQALPEDVRESYADPASSYSFGWSHGKVIVALQPQRRFTLPTAAGCLQPCKQVHVLGMSSLQRPMALCMALVWAEFTGHSSGEPAARGMA